MKTSQRQLSFHPSLIPSVTGVMPSGHVGRLPDDVPADKALNCHINLSLGRPPSSQWRRRPGCPVADGPISSGQITTFNLQTSGGVLSTVVTEGRRYGPCRLSDNNKQQQCMEVLIYKRLQMWHHNDVIGRNKYLISTLSESAHHSWRYERKCECVYFYEHSVNIKSYII